MSLLVLSCPHCSGSAVAHPVRDGVRVVCTGCGASGPSEFHGPATIPSSTERAIAAWNRRASPTMSAASYLRGTEWSMGNGQCPECHGVPASWHGHPRFLTANTIGHKADCPLAAALRDVGETPLMLGDFKSDIEYEVICDPFLRTRPKT